MGHADHVHVVRMVSNAQVKPPAPIFLSSSVFISKATAYLHSLLVPVQTACRYPACRLAMAPSHTPAATALCRYGMSLL